MTGPAHQIAAAASDWRTLSSDSGLTPIATSTARLLAIWASGPATEIMARSISRSGRRGWNDV